MPLVYKIPLMTDSVTKAILKLFYLPSLFTIGQLPRVSVEDPERIRVDSVFETLVCLFFVCLQI